MDSKQYIHMFDRKLKGSLLIIMLYVFLCNLRLPWVEQSTANLTFMLPMEKIFGITQPPDYGVSLMALGLGPWLRARILVQLGFMLFGIKGEAARKSEQISNLFTLVFACVSAFGLMQRLSGPENIPAVLWKTSTIFNLVAGVFLVVWLAQNNQLYGIGGSSLLVLINIIRNQSLQLFQGREYIESLYPILKMGGAVWLGIALFILAVLLIMVLLETTRIRLPVHHVMLHSSQMGENYMALKLNPAGAMPVMFSSVVYEVLYLLIRFLSGLFPNAEALAWLAQYTSLQYIGGIVLFLLVFILLSLLFSLVSVNPKETAETMQQSGDYLVGVRPGRDTQRYLKRTLLISGGFSAAVMCVLLAVPMLMNIRFGGGNMQSPVVSLVILVGIVLQIIEEARMLLLFKSYKTLTGAEVISGD